MATMQDAPHICWKYILTKGLDILIDQTEIEPELEVLVRLQKSNLGTETENKESRNNWVRIDSWFLN